jgi:hypothetical protein
MKEYTKEELAQRRYERRKRQYYFGALLAVMTVLVSITLIMFLLPRPTESVKENRMLAPFPKLTFDTYVDGSFTRDLTKWFADTVPFRDDLVELSGRINELEGIRQDNIKFHGNVNIVAEEEGGVHIITQVTEPPQTVATTLPSVGIATEPRITVTTPAETDPPQTGDQTMEFNNNGIVTVGDRSFMLFGGSSAQGKYYADVINAYKAEMGDDVNVYSMVVPTAVEFYLPAQYSDYSASEKTQIDHIYNNLVNVTPVDAYSELKAHTNEDIYLKTDHHWAQLGAYYASVAFAKAMGVTPQSIEDYEKVTREGYVGSLYGYTNDIKIKESPEDFVYYKQPLPYRTYFYEHDTLESIGEGQLYYEAATIENAYGMFIGKDAIHTKIVTENKNGKKLCVFKDSFGNALIPSLIPYFEEIYVIDFRFFGMSAVEYMKNKGITDILFVDNIFAANTKSLINGLDTMRTGPYRLS